MGAPKKYRITIEQIKRENHEVVLEGESAMSALDQGREMVKVRNQRNKIEGNIFSVTKVEEVKNG
jgi:hypothetical protein